MKLRQIRHCIAALITFVMIGCTGGNGSNSGTDPRPKQTYSISGYAQKGPFVAGSAITIQELNEDLTPSGRIFRLETDDNSGRYHSSISLLNPIIEISVSGYYFNEVTGALSDSTLELSSLADVRVTPEVNVNILTHLARTRIHKLFPSKMSFTAAKQHAEEDVREVCNLETTTMPVQVNNFDQLNLANEGIDNTYLFLCSAILQATHTNTANFSVFLANLSIDISDNGLVDNVENL